jgi:hypothetical protein
MNLSGFIDLKLKGIVKILKNLVNRV